MSNDEIASVRGADRIEAMDVLRGVALFGILLMNITMFGLPESYSDPTVYGGAEGINLWSWIIPQMAFEGTQRGMFSLLFGAGIILLTTRLEAAGRTDVADIYFRRNLWLVGFGIVHSFILLWLGEILFYYGVTALFLYALRNMAPRRLIAFGAAGLILTAVWNYADTSHALDLSKDNIQAEETLASGSVLPPDLADAQSEWEDYVSDWKPDQEKLEETVETYKSGYFKILAFQAPTNTHYQSWWLYRYFFDIASMMMFGMALFKMGVLTLEKRTSFYALTALIGYGIGLTINYFETIWIIKNEFSVLSFLQAGISYDVGRLAITVGHLGALLLFCKSGILPWLRRSLAAVGRMALTNYVSHSIICAFIFYGFGFGLYGDLERHQLYYVVFGIWLFQLIASPIWLSRFRFGPLEWCWRALTYMRKPNLRHPIPKAPVAPSL